MSLIGCCTNESKSVYMMIYRPNATLLRSLSGVLMSQENEFNRRLHTRAEPHSFAPIRVDINGDGFIEVLNVADISEGGIRINVPHHFEGCHIEKSVTFIITLPAPINMHFKESGYIKHVLDDSFGVNFINPSHKSRALIRRYIGLWLLGNSRWFYYVCYRLGLKD
jgi:hypothetical protein